MLAAGGGTARLLQAAQLARSPGRKQKPSGKSYCVDLGVGGHRHVKVRMCAFLFIIWFARTPQNTVKKQKMQQTEQTPYDIPGKVRGTKNQPTDQRTNGYMFGPVSFVVDP